MTYELCMKIINNTNFTKEELRQKFDILYLMNSLTEVQYRELIDLLSPVEVV